MTKEDKDYKEELTRIANGVETIAGVLKFFLIITIVCIIFGMILWYLGFALTTGSKAL